MEVTIHQKKAMIIDTKVDLKDDQDQVHMTWLYGSTKWEKRLQLWEELRNISSNRTGPWICMGDCNEIAQLEEKEGGRPKQQRMMDAFNEMMQDAHLVDMGFKGQPFTWINNREGNNRI